MDDFCNKEIYLTYNQADLQKKYNEENFHRKLWIYFCKDCQGFHLSSSRPRKRNKKPPQIKKKKDGFNLLDRLFN